MSSSVEIIGIDATLAAFDQEIARIILESDIAIEETCQLVQSEAMEHCPVGTPESTHKKGYVGGTLKNSINYEHEAGSCEGQVGTGDDVLYGPFVEHGTSKMAAQPFMFPASEVGRQYLVQRCQEIGQ